MCIRDRGSAIVNGHSGIVNTDSGERQKAFTFEQNQCSRCQNQCSRSTIMGVHDAPEYAPVSRANSINYKWLPFMNRPNKLIN